MSGEEVNQGGRPSKYNSAFNDQAFKLSLLGATDKEIADFFEVAEDTIHEWKKVYPKFSESIKDGKTKADSQVAQKLYDRAMGAEYTEQQAFKLRNQSASGVFTEEVKLVDVKRVVPPDTQAISLWLRNRKSSKWQEKTVHAGDPENPVMPSPMETARSIAFILNQAKNGASS